MKCVQLARLMNYGISSWSLKDHSISSFRLKDHSILDSILELGTSYNIDEVDRVDFDDNYVC